MNKEEIMNLNMEEILSYQMELKICNSTKDSPKVYIDLSDYLWAKDFAWCSAKTGGKTYIARTFGIDNNHRGFQYLHREIMGLKRGDKLTVDHRDGNPFNNCRSNLRIATTAQNTRNQKRSNSTGWIGVQRVQKNKTERYFASLKVNYQSIYLGTFPTKEEAGLVRDMAAVIYHKDFAVLNYPKNYILGLVNKVKIKLDF